MVIMVWI